MNRLLSSALSTRSDLGAGRRSGPMGALLMVALVALVGCGSPGPYASLADANGAYQRGDYPQAYAFASAISNDGPSLDRFEAAYIAGLAATQLGEDAKAVKHLKRAVRAYDKQMASDAGVMLGLAYARQGKDAEAAETLIAAAPGQAGEAQAKAWFHAADAQQRLGRWASARDYLLLAKSQDARRVADRDHRRAAGGQRLHAGDRVVRGPGQRRGGGGEVRRGGERDRHQGRADGRRPRPRGAGAGARGRVLDVRLGRQLPRAAGPPRRLRRPASRGGRRLGAGSASAKLGRWLRLLDRSRPDGRPSSDYRARRRCPLSFMASRTLEAGASASNPRAPC